MSYILEALKKSEQERNPDKVPDLSTQHQAVATPQAKGVPWAWIITTVIVLNIIFWYVFLFHNPTDSVDSNDSISITSTTQQVELQAQPEEVATKPVASTEQPVVSNTLAQEVTNPPPLQQVTATNTATNDIIVSEPTPEHAQKQPEPSRQANLSFDELPHISELPMSLQGQIKDMSFTTHIYVRDGGSFVIINNSSLSDGMSLGSGLVLESIVKQGVILSYRNRRFTLRSMESWTRN